MAYGAMGTSTRGASVRANTMAVMCCTPTLPEGECGGMQTAARGHHIIEQHHMASLECLAWRGWTTMVPTTFCKRCALGRLACGAVSLMRSRGLAQGFARA